METSGGERRIGSALSGRFAPLLLSLWTLFVWGGRLRNLWLELGSLGDVSRWSLVGSVIFTVLGLGVLTLWSFARSTGPAGSWSHRWFGAVVVGLAAFTTAVWLVRGVDIALGDHSVPFIVVHVVLAAVSIALAVLAVRSIRRQPTVIASSEAGEPGRSPVG